jgi:hypothetical protein
MEACDPCRSPEVAPEGKPSMQFLGFALLHLERCHAATHIHQNIYFRGRCDQPSADHGYHALKQHISDCASVTSPPSYQYRLTFSTSPQYLLAHI